MAMTLTMITVDTTDALALARWWADATGAEILQENQGWYVMTRLPDGLRMSFQKVDEPSPGKNRIHLDLLVPDRKAEVVRLIEAGASLIAEQEMRGHTWTVLADPDGNQFCVAASPKH